MYNDNGHPTDRVGGYGSQMQAALEFLCNLVRDGLKSGFFEYQISCEVGTKGRRQLIIRGGTSRKFNIPEEELPS